VWSSWKDPDSGDRVTTCSIVTGRPNEYVAPIHDRMPVILAEQAWADWLDPGVEDRGLLEGLLTVFPEDRMAGHPVSTLVNKVANNFEECIAPLDTGAIEQLSLDDQSGA
jgi:putative SOS response-associated peptidase YedK